MALRDGHAKMDTDDSATVTTVTTSTGETYKKNSIAEFSTDLLRVYYGRLFPYDAMFNWLSYGNDPSSPSPYIERDFFLKREWSFTIEDDIYIRYQSFRDKDEMRSAITKRQPHKIDIGAVFSAPPKDHTTIKPELFKTVERELVFDIDMTDYDSIRTCCTGANICRKCWPYMTMAMKVVDRALRDDFAFQHILWIYSGRRGIHCWVSDAEARILSNEARSAIVEYLSVEVGSSDNSSRKNAFSHPLHPTIRRAYNILEPYFAEYIASNEGQGILATKNQYIKVLNTLPNDAIRMELYENWERSPTLSGTDRWEQLKAATTPPTQEQQQHQVKRRKIAYAELVTWRHELVFTHCYPRLDANVSKSQNHLLKSPFCVHPKTGRVCIPIDPDRADEFDPFSVPTLRSLCEEIDVYDRENPDDADVEDYKKTSLRDALVTFERSFMHGLRSSVRDGLRSRADEAAAMTVDF